MAGAKGRFILFARRYCGIQLLCFFYTVTDPIPILLLELLFRLALLPWLQAPLFTLLCGHK
jgi:hypothetical protein